MNSYGNLPKFTPFLRITQNPFLRPKIILPDNLKNTIEKNILNPNRHFFIKRLPFRFDHKILEFVSCSEAGLAAYEGILYLFRDKLHIATERMGKQF